MKVSKLLRGLGFVGRVAAGAAAQGAQSVARIGLEEALTEQLRTVDGVAEASVDRPVISGGLARTYRARVTLRPDLDPVAVRRAVEQCQRIFDEGRARSILDPRLEITVHADDATVLLTLSRWKQRWTSPVDDATALQTLLDEARAGGGTAEARDGDVRLRFTASLDAVSTPLLAARPDGARSWLRSWERDGASVVVRSAPEPIPLEPTLFTALVDADVQRIEVSPEARRCTLHPHGEPDDHQIAQWLAHWRESATDAEPWEVIVATVGAWRVAPSGVEVLEQPHRSEEWRARSARIAAMLSDGA
ncbi:hypothetical protein [uncultured Tessaracoccus sp.]|uniref:hypothetical protein n=1 Tax=uncultured Tessaracoccus sp. TaxID=905023 RepID=UPI00261B9E30|nr:hypothetical protein [uncultured Tessaracoccus sp.]